MPRSNDYPPNLWTLLQRAARLCPERGLTIGDNESLGPISTFSYPQLLQVASKNAGVLLEDDVANTGRIVLLYFNDHERNIIWTWSVIAAGGIPAIVPPFSQDETTFLGQIENLNRLFDAPIVLTSRSQQTHFQQFPAFQLYCVEDLELRVGQVDFHPPPRPGQDIDPESIAVLLFTSGSTEHSKVIEMRHRQLIISAEAKHQLHGTSCETNFMTWVSFDHSANFAEVHINAMNTGSNQLHIPTIDLISDPAQFYNLLSDHQIAYTFCPNSFLRRATKAFQERRPQLSRKIDLGALSVVMVGGEANHASAIYETNTLMESYGAKEGPVKAAYGLSETCSACFYNLESPLYDITRNNQFSSVGKPLHAGLELRIVDAASASPNSGISEGAIQLRGDIISKGYYKNPSATQASMRADGWFDTGDLGRLDENGNLEIVGRKKEMLVINGNKYSSFALEEAIEARISTQLVNHSYTAAFNVWDRRSGSEGVVILFNPTNDEMFKDEEALESLVNSIRQACMAFSCKAPLDVVPLPRDRMPKSSIGKLSRQKLRQRYLEGDFDEYKVRSNNMQENLQGPKLTSPLGIKIAECIAKEMAIPATSMTAATPVIHSGLDSISYMRIRKEIQSFLSIKDVLPPRVLFESSNIGELEETLNQWRSLSPTRTLWPNYDTPLVTLRATGSKPPLFCVHAGDGEVTHFLPLLRCLPDRPIYGFQAKGRNDSREGHFACMDELVTCYYNVLRETQPHGPYAIIGYCFGGVVAFELARRLEADGHPVAFCGGIDTSPNLLDAIQSNIDVRRFTLETLTLLGLIDEGEFNHCMEILSQTSDDMDVVFETLRQVYQADSDWLGLTAARMETWWNSFLGLLAIAKAHKTQGNILKYDCFFVPPGIGSRWSMEEWEGKIQQWQQFATYTKSWRAQGHHYTILKEPNIKCFAECLHQAFKQAGID